MAEYIECPVCFRDFRGEIGLKIHMNHAHYNKLNKQY